MGKKWITLGKFVISSMTGLRWGGLWMLALIILIAQRRSRRGSRGRRLFNPICSSLYYFLPFLFLWLAPLS